MATALNYLTLSEFERRFSGEKPAFEYWFGDAPQKPMATLLHGALQLVIAMMLRLKGWKVGTKVTLKLSSFARPIPDIIADSTALQSPYPSAPFDLCVEILSPEDSLDRTVRKAEAEAFCVDSPCYTAT